MPGELERLPALLIVAALGADSFAVSGEPLGRVRAALPGVRWLGEQVLPAARLTRLRSARTRGLEGGR